MINMSLVHRCQFHDSILDGPRVRFTANAETSLFASGIVSDLVLGCAQCSRATVE